MAGMDRPKKMLVRTAFVTGTTVATLLGAQTLALLDQRMADQIDSGSGEVVLPLPIVIATGQPELMPTATVLRVAPNIVVLREAGQAVVAPGQPASAPPANTVAIQPPSPVQLSAPAPIIVQQPGGGQAAVSVQAQPAPATTQSSR
jgi:hypothetical protein